MIKGAEYRGIYTRVCYIYTYTYYIYVHIYTHTQILPVCVYKYKYQAINIDEIKGLPNIVSNIHMIYIYMYINIL